MMKRIESFCVDHNKLECGIYISRIDNDIVTYDMRFVKPNTPAFLSPDAMHTIEHLFATYARNSIYSDNVIYFGPMGCRTGFYFLCRGLSHDTALSLIKETITKCRDHKGDIPGSSKIECGNYLAHDFDGAIQALTKYYDVIKDYTTDMLVY